MAQVYLVEGILQAPTLIRDPDSYWGKSITPELYLLVLQGDPTRFSHGKWDVGGEKPFVNMDFLYCRDGLRASGVTVDCNESRVEQDSYYFFAPEMRRVHMRYRDIPEVKHPQISIDGCVIQEERVVSPGYRELCPTLSEYPDSLLNVNDAASLHRPMVFLAAKTIVLSDRNLIVNRLEGLTGYQRLVAHYCDSL